MAETEDYILTKKMVREKYHNRCYRCGVEENQGNWLNVIHIKPKCQGGTDELSNLLLSCEKCKKYANANGTEFDPVSEDNLLEMEEYCVAKFQKKKFIKPYSYIDYKTLTTLRSIRAKTAIKIVMDSIESLEVTSHTKYFKVQVSCSKCNALWDEYLSKTELQYTIASNDDGECPKCEESRKIIETAKYQLAQSKKEEIKRKNTADFIANYLDPERAWIKEFDARDKYNDLKGKIINTDVEEVADYIKSMDYKDFLKTPYWNGVASYKKHSENYKCELCNSGNLLNVHHKIYDHHGKELSYLKDLTVLCGECHKKFHNIKEVC